MHCYYLYHWLYKCWTRNWHSCKPRDCEGVRKYNLLDSLTKDYITYVHEVNESLFNWATFFLEWWASTPPNVSSQLNPAVIWLQCLLPAIQKEKMRKSWQNRCYFSFSDLYLIAGPGKKRAQPVFRVPSQGFLRHVPYVDKLLIIFNKGQWSALHYLLLELE